jgi:hypothetical protein
MTNMKLDWRVREVSSTMAAKSQWFNTAKPINRVERDHDLIVSETHV